MAKQRPKIVLPKTRPRMLRPVWADPRLLLGQSHYEASRVVVAGNAGHIIVPANPSRFMIGFSMGSAVVLGAVISPHNLGAIAPFVNVNANATQWFTLFDHGPIVCYPWYGLNCDTLGFVLHEVIID